MRSRKGFIIFTTFAVIFVLMIMFGALSVPVLYRLQLLKRNINSAKAYYLAKSGISYGSYLSAWGIPENLPQEYEVSFTEPDEIVTVTLGYDERILKIESETAVNGITQKLVKEEHNTGFNRYYPGFSLLDTPYPFKRPVIKWKPEETE